MAKKSGRLDRNILAALLVALAGGSLWHSNAEAQQAGAPMVTTDSGEVVGMVRGDAAVFLGIPYAAPTGGANRFRPPQPREPWSAPLQATQLAVPCAQTAQLGAPSVNEDCLILNVFAPRQLAGRRPVMLFVHGGFYTGSSSNPYNAQAIVEQAKVVVVTVNYRLGAFAAMTLPALSAENPSRTSGNTALLDQQAALRWVKRNIERFGGDPGNITFFGESAGAGFLVAHLLAPSSAGLFEWGISQSLPGVPSRTLAQAEAAWLAAINRANQPAPQGVDLGCPTTLMPDELLACLRAVPANKLATVAGGSAPIVDGHVVPLSFSQAAESGQFNRVPLIMGSNHDEGTFFVNASIPSQAAYQGALAGMFGSGSVASIVLRYPASQYGGSFTQAFAAVFGDWLISCGTERVRRALSRYSAVYGFEFGQNPAALLRPVVQLPDVTLGATHTAELAYVFGLDANGPLQPGPHLDLSEKFIAYWTGFARTGDPNTPAGQGAKAGYEDRPQWPAYRGADPQLLSLATPVTVNSVADFNADHQCAFWDAR